MQSDNEIYAKLIEQITNDHRINAENISFNIKEGIVTIVGIANSYQEKRDIERIISSNPDVRAVASNLSVKMIDVNEKSDSEIAKAVAEFIANESSIPNNNIRIIVENGQVNLNGTVEWSHQKETLEESIRSLGGVIAVTNNITIKPSAILPADVKNQILKEFEKNAEIDAQAIEVEVNGNKVILKGVVRSWAEFDEATQAAWSIPGVASVDNELKVI